MSLPQQRVLFRRLIGRRRSTSRHNDCFNRIVAVDWVSGNDARFQCLRIIPSQMQPARRASSFQVMFLSWMTNSLCFQQRSILRAQHDLVSSLYRFSRSAIGRKTRSPRLMVLRAKSRPLKLHFILPTPRGHVDMKPGGETLSV